MAQPRTQQLQFRTKEKREGENKEGDVRRLRNENG